MLLKKNTHIKVINWSLAMHITHAWFNVTFNWGQTLCLQLLCILLLVSTRPFKCQYVCASVLTIIQCLEIVHYLLPTSTSVLLFLRI